jgi:hypothetical protein
MAVMLHIHFSAISKAAFVTVNIPLLQYAKASREVKYNFIISFDTI